MATERGPKTNGQLELDPEPALTPEELERAADAILADLCARHPLGRPPRLLWKPYRVSAGKAYLRDGTIGLSRLLLTGVERLRDTLVHEYAHLLAVDRQGLAGAGHGPAWRKAMKDLGAPPEVYHHYAVRRNVRRQKAIYACSKCGARFETHRRFPRGRRYAHRDCGGILRLLRVERVTS
ncbi:MAG: SprT-like domain-containing protein [Fimbriimonadaceae bacterium]|nr:SprT-like domain-containing protein [Fimbriimonadaceae bacterium]